MDEKTVKQARAALLKWHRASARKLPWRETRDAYAILVSEIMLQQTRVETVVPYYEQWMKRFPTVQKLAAADEEAVLKMWEGLGYYSRARSLQRAAREIAGRMGGKMPENAAGLSKLPGVGAYTAGAVASIAFGEPVPAVDGNALRVLARLTAEEASVDGPEGKNRLTALAGALVSRRWPGDFNQAVMELGALVCKPRNPECGRCPIQKFCLARRDGRQAELPVKKAKSERPERREIALVVASGGKWLIRRRPAGGLLGGLWEFPAVSHQENALPTAGEAAAAVEKLTGVKPADVQPLESVRHEFSHFRLLLYPFLCRINENAAPPERDALWAGFEALESKPFSRSHRRIVEQIGKAAKRGAAGSVGKKKAKA